MQKSSTKLANQIQQHIKELYTTTEWSYSWNSRMINIWKSIILIYHTNRMKDKNPMIILTEIEKH